MCSFLNMFYMSQFPGATINLFISTVKFSPKMLQHPFNQIILSTISNRNISNPIYHLCSCTNRKINFCYIRTKPKSQSWLVNLIVFSELIVNLIVGNFFGILLGMLIEQILDLSVKQLMDIEASFSDLIYLVWWDQI